MANASNVYFIQCGEFVKIGKADNPRVRLSELTTGNPLDMKLLYAVPGCENVERSLHRWFRTYHHRGEWFRFEGELRDWIERGLAAATRSIDALHQWWNGHRFDPIPPPRPTPGRTNADRQRAYRERLAAARLALAKFYATPCLIYGFN
jgi:hypothetical protein